MQDGIVIISRIYGPYPSCEKIVLHFGILTYCFAEAFGWEPSFPQFNLDLHVS